MATSGSLADSALSEPCFYGEHKISSITTVMNFVLVSFNLATRASSALLRGERSWLTTPSGLWTNLVSAQAIHNYQNQPYPIKHRDAACKHISHVGCRLVACCVNNHGFDTHQKSHSSLNIVAGMQPLLKISLHLGQNKTKGEQAKCSIDPLGFNHVKGYTHLGSHVWWFPQFMLYERCSVCMLDCRLLLLSQCWLSSLIIMSSLSKMSSLINISSLINMSCRSSICHFIKCTPPGFCPQWLEMYQIPLKCVT